MSNSQKSGIEFEAYQVVYRPLVTEKGTHLSEVNNTYTFEVNSLATKRDIKNAVAELWNVRVVGVRTQNRQGKRRRYKTHYGLTKRWKKAIVQLHEDDRIAFF